MALIPSCPSLSHHQPRIETDIQKLIHNIIIIPASSPIKNNDMITYLTNNYRADVRIKQGHVWKAQCLTHTVLYLVAQSCPTLWDPMDSSPPGSSVHGILQARILDWVAMPSSRGFSPPRDRAQVSYIVGRFFTIWDTREVLTHVICSISLSFIIFISLTIIIIKFCGNISCRPWELPSPKLQSKGNVFLTSASGKAASRHFWAASWVVNWANAQPTQRDKTKWDPKLPRPTWKPGQHYAWGSLTWGRRGSSILLLSAVKLN